MYDELELKLDHVAFWTDSMIVLGYIKNVSCRFKTFVGNGLSEIHGVSSSDQWRHIESHMYPAGITSRGVFASDKESFSVCLKGSAFIWRDSAHEVAEDDIEVKKEIVINAITQCFFDGMVDHHSDWRKLQRVTA